MLYLLLVLMLLSPMVPVSDININSGYVSDYYDGDTFFIDLPGIHPVFGKRLPIRVYGADTPEIRSSCKDEVAKYRETTYAKIVAEYTKLKILNSKKIDLIDISRGSRFRVIAKVYIDDKDLALDLIEKRYAMPITTKRFDWCTYLVSEDSPFKLNPPVLE